MVRISGLVYLMVTLDEPKIDAPIKHERHWLYGQFSPLFTAIFSSFSRD